MMKIFKVNERRNFKNKNFKSRWKVFISAICCVFFLSVFVSSSLASEVHWSYSGAEGPENWENLSPAFKEAVGDAQSPIDIPTESERNGVEFFYKDGDFSILNNGHTLQVVPKDGAENYIVLGGVRYRLQQLHFHTPSEHTLNGTQAPMEIHFVHGDDKGRLAVVGLFIDEGPENEAIALAWSAAPRDRGKTEQIEKTFPLTNLLPRNLSGIRYNGSLTTPPTTEGVSWVILSEHGTAGAGQIQWFTDLIGRNARPVQPRNSRILTPF
ncbi:MAG: carbonic anhydrase family protein [Synergistaceae bacterium]|jgi:carbonic anhydrase|nr:carbonic anhydrase family protein [Synergistaceae bacterium]